MPVESSRGTSLVEVLIGAIGLVIVVTLALRTLADLTAQAEAQRVRAARVQSTRIARSVIRAEVAEATHPGDVTVFPPDSVRLRAFRGLAHVCPGTSDSVITVQWVGRRAPVPAKDSVRALLGDGSWMVSDLVRVGASGYTCGPRAGVSSTWVVRPALPGAVLLRLYEPGSYHLADATLRYRSGRSGRQPLTEATMAGAGFARRGDIVVGEWSVLATGRRAALYLGPVR